MNNFGYFDIMSQSLLLNSEQIRVLKSNDKTSFSLVFNRNSEITFQCPKNMIYTMMNDDHNYESNNASTMIGTCVPKDICEGVTAESIPVRGHVDMFQLCSDGSVHYCPQSTPVFYNFQCQNVDPCLADPKLHFHGLLQNNDD
jgi:hypothetical protein